MSELYRAIYTRCRNGRNFHGVLDSREEQKIFATSGKMQMSDTELSAFAQMAESALKMNPYSNRCLKPVVYRFFRFNTTDVLLCWRMMDEEETGTRLFFINKALMGAFNRHPMEYFSPSFFNGDDYFWGYASANGMPIREYKQLLSYKESAYPPDFPPIPQEELFRLDNSYPVMDFETAGEYVKPHPQVDELVRAAVHHLITQMTLPEENRRSIIIRGSGRDSHESFEQIRYMISAIGYAFPVQAALNIPLAFNTPVTKFNYSFKFAAIIGLDNNDPDVKDLKAALPNTIFLEDIPAAPTSGYYACISRFNAEHYDFIFNFLSQCNTIAELPMLYEDFRTFKNHLSEMLSFLEGKITNFTLKEFHDRLQRYVSAQLYLCDFYNAVLAVAQRIEPQKFEDIHVMLKTFDTIERMITAKVAQENDVTVEMIHEEYMEAYSKRFFYIFEDILSDKYSFFNIKKSDPQEIFNYIVTKNASIAYKIAEWLTDDQTVDKYMFALTSVSVNSVELATYKNITIPKRIDFFKYLLLWRQQHLTHTSAKYICKAFNSILIQNRAIEAQNTKNPHIGYGTPQPEDTRKYMWAGKLNFSDRMTFYKYIFAPFYESKLDSKEPINNFGRRGLDVYIDCDYKPREISDSHFKETIQDVFARNFLDLATEIDNSKKKLDVRLIEMKKLVDTFGQNGVSERVLARQYLERVIFDDNQSVLYYKYALKVFGVMASEIIYMGQLDIALGQLFINARYTESDERFLKISLNLLNKIDNFQDQPIALNRVDSCLGKLFKYDDWESYVTKEKYSVRAFSEHFFKLALPNSTRIVLFNKLNDFNSKKDAEEADTILMNFVEQRINCFTQCPESYKEALLRILERKKWSGSFYLHLLMIFEKDESFTQSILSVISVSESISGASAFGDLCYYLATTKPQTPAIISAYNSVGRFYRKMKHHSTAKEKYAVRFIKSIQQYANKDKIVQGVLNSFDKSQGESLSRPQEKR